MLQEENEDLLGYIINDFKNLLDSNTLNEDKLITNVKGYSVTKIGFNGCK